MDDRCYLLTTLILTGCIAWCLVVLARAWLAGASRRLVILTIVGAGSAATVVLAVARME